MSRPVGNEVAKAQSKVYTNYSTRVGVVRGLPGSVQDMLATEMTTPLLCAKQAASVMKGVGGSVVFVANAGDRGLTDGAGNLGAISALTSSAAAAGGPVGIRVNCVSHALGSQDEECESNGNGGHGTFSLATMRGPSAEDVAMQVKVWGAWGCCPAKRVCFMGWFTTSFD